MGISISDLTDGEGHARYPADAEPDQALQLTYRLDWSSRVFQDAHEIVFPSSGKVADWRAYAEAWVTITLCLVKEWDLNYARDPDDPEDAPERRVPLSRKGLQPVPTGLLRNICQCCWDANRVGKQSATASLPTTPTPVGDAPPAATSASPSGGSSSKAPRRSTARRGKSSVLAVVPVARSG